MKRGMGTFLELVCFCVGLFLIAGVVMSWVNVELNLELSPQFCLILGIALVCVGLIMRLSKKKNQPTSEGEKGR
jgi:hypothetical protein